MNYLEEKFNSLLEKRLNTRFQKLVQKGLLARDVDAVKLQNEKRARLVLLCLCNDEGYAVICTNTYKQKNTSLSYFELLGHYIKAKKAVVSSDLVDLTGRYEGYKAHLIVAQDVAIRN